MPHILIFKTNIATAEDRSKVAPLLNGQPFIEQWTVDIEDVDCVLRVVTAEPAPQPIIALVNAGSYECTELED
ncbi:hypothetical protein [Chitinophaga arvensicola]|uniref:Uncharacterized protein n=1 Tax=Chitinophaga arvensicola TaxID=29529 RepID=A0A1I0RDY5_9BACT|nr:hypothetical protein [Chitinophaga arvensicola]SEW39068.1 hypothetical protein SAMN04488122_2697 [Chitinophaga arvensicola]